MAHAHEPQGIFDALGVQHILQQQGAAPPEVAQPQAVVPDLDLQPLFVRLSDVLPACVKAPKSSARLLNRQQRVCPSSLSTQHNCQVRKHNSFLHTP